MSERNIAGMEKGLIPGSDIRIDSEGTWFYRDTRMTRQDIIGLFYKHLKQEDSGRYCIEIGEQRCPVDVEDTAYVIWTLRWAGAGASEDSALLYLSDGSTEKMDPGTLHIEVNHIPYCNVKGGRFKARFSRPAYYELAERLRYDPANDSYFVSLNNRTYPLSHRIG